MREFYFLILFHNIIPLNVCAACTSVSKVLQLCQLLFILHFAKEEFSMLVLLLFRMSTEHYSDSEDKPSDESDTKVLTSSFPYSTEQDRYMILFPIPFPICVVPKSRSCKKLLAFYVFCFFLVTFANKIGLITT